LSNLSAQVLLFTSEMCNSSELIGQLQHAVILFHLPVCAHKNMHSKIHTNT